VPRRSVSIPLWSLIVAVFLIGTLAGGVIALAMTRSRAPDPASTSSHIALPSTSPPASVPLTITPTVNAPATSTPAESISTLAGTPTPVPTPAPQGIVILQGPPAGRGYGQDTYSDTCSQWTLRLTNNTDTELRQLRFAALSANYTDLEHYDSTKQDFPTRPARTPDPVSLDFSVPAHSTQDVRFLTCTSTPNPGGSYSFGVVPADKHLVVWSTGYRARVALT
jgi:hypothetical protein